MGGEERRGGGEGEEWVEKREGEEVKDGGGSERIEESRWRRDFEVERFEWRK